MPPVDQDLDISVELSVVTEERRLSTDGGPQARQEGPYGIALDGHPGPTGRPPQLAQQDHEGHDPGSGQARANSFSLALVGTPAPSQPRSL